MARVRPTSCSAASVYVSRSGLECCRDAAGGAPASVAPMDSAQWCIHARPQHTPPGYEQPPRCCTAERDPVRILSWQWATSGACCHSELLATVSSQTVGTAGWSAGCPEKLNLMTLPTPDDPDLLCWPAISKYTVMYSFFVHHFSHQGFTQLNQLTSLAPVSK